MNVLVSLSYDTKFIMDLKSATVVLEALANAQRVEDRYRRGGDTRLVLADSSPASIAVETRIPMTRADFDALPEPAAD